MPGRSLGGGQAICGDGREEHIEVWVLGALVDPFPAVVTSKQLVHHGPQLRIVFIQNFHKDDRSALQHRLHHSAEYKFFVTFYINLNQIDLTNATLRAERIDARHRDPNGR